MKYPKLFSPLDIRGITLPNRIMSTAAVTRLAAEDGHDFPLNSVAKWEPDVFAFLEQHMRK